MPFLKGAIETDGALIDVLFGWSANAVLQLRASLRPIPQPVGGRALLDTGAEITCLDSSLARSLSLVPHGPAVVNAPAIGGLGIVWQYHVALTIIHPGGIASDHLAIGDATVLEASLSVLGYQALIGRDVLSRCHFLYDGPAHRFKLTY